MRSTWMKWVGKALLWFVTVIVAMGMIEAGAGKFRNADGWDHWMVEVWGYPGWFRAFVGHSEYAGGVLLFLPRMAPYAAGYLIAIMLGAFVTVTTRQSDLSWFDPLLFALLLSIVLAARWRGRYRWREGPAE